MIIKNNEEALRIKCVDVLPDEIGHIIDLLEVELKNSEMAGVGLAAPQIGIGKNVAIVRLGQLKLNLVNCKIAIGFDKKIFESEGCLSFPGRYETTHRYQEIQIIDNAVEPYSFIATGLLAVVCQHEIDHTRGILLPDLAIKKDNTIKKVGPNDPCVCMSGKKYKKCCGR